MGLFSPILRASAAQTRDFVYAQGLPCSDWEHGGPDGQVKLSTIQDRSAVIVQVFEYRENDIINLLRGTHSQP